MLKNLLLVLKKLSRWGVNEMDISEPMFVVTSSLDGPILGILARSSTQMTTAQVHHQMRQRASYAGVARTLKRLDTQGIVTRKRVGQAWLWQLNNSHIATPHIVGLANIRKELVGRIKATIQAWDLKPRTALIYGSFARGEGSVTSDIDILLVHPDHLTDAEQLQWDHQYGQIMQQTHDWTGNTAQIVQFSESEFERAATTNKTFVNTVSDEGISLL